MWLKKPIQIPEDIAAKYDQPGQFEVFDEAFKKLIALSPDAVPHPKDAPKHPGSKGRPKK